MAIVRCYVEGRGDQWEGVCLDFDLAVQGRSFEEVYSSLNRAIGEYIEYVHSLPEKEQPRFLRRRVPLSARLRFAFRVLATSFLVRPRDGGPSQRHEYTMPCAA